MLLPILHRQTVRLYQLLLLPNVQRRNAQQLRVPRAVQRVRIVAQLRLLPVLTQNVLHHHQQVFY